MIYRFRLLAWTTVGMFAVPEIAGAQGSLPPVPVVTRRIPLRIVETLACNPTAATCSQSVPFDEVRASLELANEYWRFVGVEFWIKSFDYVYAPNLYDRSNKVLSWGQVRTELQSMFPGKISNQAYVPSTSMTDALWMRSAATFYSDPNEVFVWLMSSGQSSGCWPWMGRMFYLGAQNADLGANGLPGSTLGHELGHFFGAFHNDDPTIPRHPDPSKSYTKCDRWDAFYAALPMPMFFSGPTAEGCDYANVKLIAPDAELRGATSDSMASLQVGDTIYPAGAWQIQGLIASTGVPHSPPTWGWSMNIMRHIESEMDDGTTFDGRTPRFFSRSQVRMMKDFLDDDITFDGADLALIKDGAGLIPIGALPGTTTSLRSKPGKDEPDFFWWSNAAAFTDFTFQEQVRDLAVSDYTPVSGDFDCDGDDDLFWYRPTTGLGNFWVSTGGHNFSYSNDVNYGADYVVFGGDFDGNTCDDLFFYKPGTGSDKLLFASPGFNWFQTPQTVNSLDYQPVVADLEGDGDDDIVWYLPKSGTADVWKGNGSTQSPGSSGTTFTKTTGAPIGPGRFYTPIVGNFDGNFGDEIVWYAGGQGNDFIWRSSPGTMSLPILIDGYYRPVAGDFNADGRDDILWDDYQSLRSPIWEGVNDTDMFAHDTALTMYGNYQGIAGDFDGDGGTDIFYYRSAMQPWTESFHYDQGWRVDKHPRLLGDLNGDKKMDVVGFGNSGVEVALSTGFGFKPTERWVENFNYNNGWRVDQHLRFLAKVDNDNKDDVVGFGNSGVMVAKSTGTGLGAVTNWLADYQYPDWLVERHPRLLADVTGEGRADVVGFGNSGVYVSTSNGSSFSAASRWVTAFHYNAGWRVELHPRLVGNVSNDQKADIVGFFYDGTYVSYSTGSGFTAPVLALAAFGNQQGWRVDRHPRFLADVDGDTISDIVGFGNNGVEVALSTGTGFASAASWSNDFGYNDGWRVEDHPRFLEDVNGDGRADIVGFANRVVYVAFSKGDSFTAPIEWINEYTPETGGWTVGFFPRLVGDVTGDGRGDIVGFGSSATWVTPSTLSFYDP